MLSRLRDIVLLITISALWTCCHGQETNLTTTSHATTVIPSVPALVNVSDTLKTTPSANSTDLVPVEATAASTTSAASITLVTTAPTNVSHSTAQTGPSPSYNTGLSNFPLTTSGVDTNVTFSNKSSTTAPDTSTTSGNFSSDNFTPANDSSTTSSPENYTPTNDSSTTTTIFPSVNTTSLNDSSSFTTNTYSTPSNTSTISQSPDSTTTPSNNVSSTSPTITTIMTLTTGPVTTTNQSEWSGNTKDTGSSTGVVLGAIFGSLLGIALVCVAAYFLCGSRKPHNISHRRLYEETRNDPVLRLDNPVSPYDVSYGDSSYYNPTAIEEAPHNGGRPHETIVMDNIRPR